LRASSPAEAAAAASIRLSELGSELSSGDAHSAYTLVAGDELVGLLSVDGAPRERRSSRLY